MPGTKYCLSDSEFTPVNRYLLPDCSVYEKTVSTFNLYLSLANSRRKTPWPTVKTGTTILHFRFRSPRPLTNPFAGKTYGNGSVHHGLVLRLFPSAPSSFLNCNYGTSEFPLDRWFGSHHDGTDKCTQAIRQQLRGKARQKKS